MGSVEEYGKTKRLTPEEMERHIMRVTTQAPPVEARDPFPICPAPQMSKEDIDKVTERLYTQSLEKKEANRQMLDARVYPQNPSGRPPQKMDEDEIAESAKRLHDTAIANREQNLKTLRESVHYKYSEPKPVPLKDFVQHMYADRIEKKKETEKRLYENYILATDINTGKISRATAAASADRLSSR